MNRGTPYGMGGGTDPVTGLPVGGGGPGMAGGLPLGMGGGLPGMGKAPWRGYGTDPDTVQIIGIRRPLSNITAYGALHLLLSFAVVPLQCAIDEHGVFLFPPSAPFRILDCNKPTFSKTVRLFRSVGST